MHCHIAVGTLDVKFSHEGAFLSLHDAVNQVINCDVLHREWGVRDAVINTVSLRGREVHYQPPFSWLILLWNYPETANMQIGERRGWEWTCNPTQGNFLLEILIDDIWVQVGGKHIICRTLQVKGRWCKPNPKAISQTRENISDC